MKHLRKYNESNKEPLDHDDRANRLYAATERVFQNSDYTAHHFYEAYSRGGGDQLSYGEVIEMMHKYSNYVMGEDVPEHVHDWFKKKADEDWAKIQEDK